MGFFSKKKGLDTNKTNWIPIRSTEELKLAYEKTNETSGLFFKHSTRCGISRMAFNRFESNWKNNENCLLYYIDLLAYRDVSDLLAEISGITHQSLQAILIKNKEIIYVESHGGISAEEINQLI